MGTKKENFGRRLAAWIFKEPDMIDSIIDAYKDHYPRGALESGFNWITIYIPEKLHLYCPKAIQTRLFFDGIEIDLTWRECIRLRLYHKKLRRTIDAEKKRLRRERLSTKLAQHNTRREEL